MLHVALPHPRGCPRQSGGLHFKYGLIFDELQAIYGCLHIFGEVGIRNGRIAELL